MTRIATLVVGLALVASVAFTGAVLVDGITIGEQKASAATDAPATSAESVVSPSTQLMPQLETDANESTPAPSPGETLASGIYVELARLNGSVTYQTLDAELAAASEEVEQAAVVAQWTPIVDQRLDALESQRERLDGERAAGDLSATGYQARLDVLAAQAGPLENVTEHLNTTVLGLSEPALTRSDVDPNTIRTLDQRAGDLRAVENQPDSSDEPSDRDSETPTGTDTQVTTTPPATDMNGTPESGRETPPGEDDDDEDRAGDEDDNDDEDDDSDDQNESDDNGDDDAGDS